MIPYRPQRLPTAWQFIILTCSSITLSGCQSLPATSASHFETTSNDQRAFIPIIYPDKVVELNPRTGQERIIPDEDLIVEDGKVWGRYLHFGRHTKKYTISYTNQLCAPTLTANIDTIGDSSRPLRSFAAPIQKYNDCSDSELDRATSRINAAKGNK